MGIKISIIGAGSAVFSLSLIRDICLTPNLQGSTVSFMDIDRERLDAAHTLCQRYAAEVGIQLDLQKTTDRRASMQGADFVINTALVAGNRRLREGMQLAAGHGYRFGGSYHIMHDEPFWVNFYQLRLFELVIQDGLEVSRRPGPCSWPIRCWRHRRISTCKYPQARIVGLCHGFSGVYHLAEALGLDRDGLTFEIPGVNDFVWLTHCYYKGEDVFPMIDRLIEKVSKERVTNSVTRRLTSTGDSALSRLVTPARRAGTWPWRYHADEATEERWRENPNGWWDGYFVHVEHNVAEINQVAANRTIKVTEYFPPHMSGEVMYRSSS